jgi:hypothetical protein
VHEALPEPLQPAEQALQLPVQLPLPHVFKHEPWQPPWQPPEQDVLHPLQDDVLVEHVFWQLPVQLDPHPAIKITTFI